MVNLTGRVAVVAGASRRAGSIALALGGAGATVYVVGRTSGSGAKPLNDAPGTIEETAEAVTGRGGKGIAVRTDCTDDRQVASVFDRVATEHDRLDLLANAVWGAADANQTMDEWTAAWGRPLGATNGGMASDDGCRSARLLPHQCTPAPADGKEGARAPRFNPFGQ